MSTGSESDSAVNIADLLRQRCECGTYTGEACALIARDGEAVIVDHCWDFPGKELVRLHLLCYRLLRDRGYSWGRTS